MTRAEHPSRRRSLLAESTIQCNDAIVVDDEACDAGNDNPIDGCERRAESLCAVLCQTLVRRTPGIQGPRQLASQLLINNNDADNIMRKAKAAPIPSIIATSRKQGMQALQTELVRLIKTGLVDELDLLAMARNKVGIEAAIADKRASSPGAGTIDVAAVGQPTNLTGAQLHTPASSGSAGHRLLFPEDAHLVPARPDACVRARRLRGLRPGRRRGRRRRGRRKRGRRRRR